MVREDQQGEQVPGPEAIDGGWGAKRQRTQRYPVEPENLQGDGPEAIEAQDVIANSCGPFAKKLTGSDIRNGLIIAQSDRVAHISPVLGNPVGANFRFQDDKNRVYELTFKDWRNGSARFTGQWSQCVEDNEMEEGDDVEFSVFQYSSGHFGGRIKCSDSGEF